MSNTVKFYIAVFLILVLIGRRAGAQSFKPTFVDTVKVRDTVYQPVPLYQSFDTSANVYLTKGNRPVLKPCFIVVTGFKQQGPKGMQWVQEPVIRAIYSKRWRLIDTKKIQKIL